MNSNCNIIWTSKSLREALNTTKIPDNISTGMVQFNSKDVKENDLFIALKGGSGDGHDYVQDAINNGAGAVIVSSEINSFNCNNISYNKIITVQDTMKALDDLATYKRQKSSAKFIAITGSVGKTSTKEAIKLILETANKVFASRGNFNNHLGILINLASMHDEINYSILELGMSSKGEILELSNIVKADIAIITLITEQHLKNFSSIYGIIDAKCEIFDGIKQNGIAILNSDDKYYNNILQNIPIHKDLSLYRFGSKVGSLSKLISYEISSNHHKTIIKYDVCNNIVTLNLNSILPFHHAENFASGLLLGHILNLDLAITAKSLEKFQLSDGRGKVIEIKLNNKNIKIICDHYNASPLSLIASFKHLEQIPYANKIIIIGDMVELGDDDTQVKFHRKLLPHIIKSRPCKIILIGKYMTMLKPNIIENNIACYDYDTTDSLINSDHLIKLICDADLILLKASRSMKLEKIIQYIFKNT
ncbi:MAG: UDP-N-acetylmuramoyl-tripeptide--D-alanyl-D-alanine ligase [Rickettsiaceae bacterium]